MRRLSAPVEGASLAVFRMVVGLQAILAAEWMLRSRGGIDLISARFGGSSIPYMGLETLTIPSVEALRGLVALSAIAGLLLAIGLATRLAAAVVFLTTSFLLALDAASYSSDEYLRALLSFLLLWMPTGRCWSIDAWILSRRKLPASTVPGWCVFLLRFQVLVVLYGGVLARLTAPWLNYGEPLHTWLKTPQVQGGLALLLSEGAARDIAPIIASAGFGIFAAYLELIYLAALGPMLLIPRTRLLAVVLAVIHDLTRDLFLWNSLELLPLTAIAYWTILLEPDWPRRFAAWVKQPTIRRPQWGWLAAGAVVVPGVGALLGWRIPPESPKKPVGAAPLSQGVLFLLLVWMIVQIVLPIRHLFVTGPVDWTGEQELFSWRMQSGVKRTLPVRIDVLDRVVTPMDATGIRRIDWTKWHGDKILYRQVEAGRVPWNQMPELLVLFQPIYGERIVFNPLAASAGSPKTLEAAKARAATLWKTKFASEAAFHETFDLAEGLKRASAQARRDGVDPMLLSRLSQTLNLSQQIAGAPAADPHREIAVLSLRNELLNLSQQPALSRTMRQMLGQAAPMAVEGGAAPRVPFLIIEDPKLQTVDGRYGSAYVSVRTEEYAKANRGVMDVWGDFDRMTWPERRPFPRAYPRVDAARGLTILWNPAVELSDSQIAMMESRPFLCLQYARKISRDWLEEYHRRPSVYFTDLVALTPYRAQLLIDPRADLASARYKLFGHNDWISELHQEPSLLPYGL